MRLLVTGAAGFIGWKVAEALLDAGHEVVGADNLAPAYDVRLKEWRVSQLAGRAGFTFVRVDVTDRTALGRVFEDAGSPPLDAVINLAARAGVRQSLDDPTAYFQTNLLGAVNLLELCRLRGVPKFVQASTSSVYGDAPRPFREDQPTDRPLSPYAASKKAAELAAFVYHQAFGLDVSVLRYFTVYGPAGRPDMSLFRFVQWISEGQPVVVYGDGLQERDFTYVDDIARGTLAALAPVGYAVINLGSDRPVKVLDAIRMIEEMVGRRAELDHRPPHPADVRATWADITRARTLLGWQPRTPFPEGVARLVEWYREHRTWARDIRT